MRLSSPPLHRERLNAPLFPFLQMQAKPASPTDAQDAEDRGWLYRNRVNILLVLLSGIVALSAGVRLLTPGLAKTLADGLPSSWVRASSEQVLSELESTKLQASQLPLPEQDALRDRFAALHAAPEGAPPYRLLFRRNIAAGNSLLTLPGGEIIVTDQFLQTVPDRGEQLALLCHELGHLYYHHALRSAIEANLYWLASAALIGSSESSVRALTRGLNHVDYSVGHVLEADSYALSMLYANKLPKHLLVEAIEHGQGPTDPDQMQNDPLAHHQYFNERMRQLQNLL